MAWVSRCGVVLVTICVATLYRHLQPASITVRTGEQVRERQVIGKQGSSGDSSSPHLHF
ncbi:MAG: hypothetical protein JWR37_4502 [Mycobacterium sp.]|jgi:murein DD-endopeptidase MepM/ murein hydrolase activator NlpD|nr:hypothetical protein [Mycobacterium sp.]